MCMGKGTFSPHFVLCVAMGEKQDNLGENCVWWLVVAGDETTKERSPATRACMSEWLWAFLLLVRPLSVCFLKEGRGDYAPRILSFE